MKTFSVSLRLMICLFALLVVSCNSKKTPSGPMDSIGYTQEAKALVTSTISPIYLDTLSIDASNLTQMPIKNFVFVHYFSDSTVTLYGWKMKKTHPDKDQFDPTANVILTNRGKTSVSIGPGSFVGNQVIIKNRLIGIKNEINGRAAELVFVPQKDSRGRLSYEILINYPSTPLNMSTLGKYSTNPSPPHQAFD